ncbi:hypothetical protein [Nocardioides sp. S5]|uniref:hypothetical protein n=1 Tax=Nocardioides sp. S5 TaxID=2017486 RepID=UPI001A906EC6|nr:hypothetical protein [Nocardioides sp. S5]
MTSEPFDDTGRLPALKDKGRVAAYRNAGLAACGVGVAVGAAMIARRREVECADGTYFPESATDFRCFAHPQALSGSAVVLICLALAAVIALCAIAATSVVSRSHSAMLLEVQGPGPARDPGRAADRD